MIADRINLVLVGASGMVGGYALHYALEHPAVERVTAIGRRTLGISHAKLNDERFQSQLRAAAARSAEAEG